MKFLNLINNAKTKFILVTFIVSGIGFLKSFILLKIFDFEKLGIIALAQTATTTISLLQIGAITGAYRLFSYKRENILKHINSAILIFFVYLSVFLAIVGFIIDLTYNTGISSFMLFVLIAIGVISLYSNWIVCKLLATKEIFVLNKAQVISALISFFVTLLAKWVGLAAVLAGLILQPALTIGFAYLSIPKLIPVFDVRGFRKYIIKIIYLGFVPYLTSALTLLNSQLSRWIITFTLGTVVLGKTFLVTLFIALVSVFPSAVSNLFFPTIIEKYEKNLKTDLNASLNKQFLILGSYYLAVILSTLLFANILVKLILPKHLESVYLIYAVIPALLFQHLSVPAITLFNAAKKFKQILHGSLISVFTYILFLIAYICFFKPSLLGYFVIESVSALLFFIYNLFYFIKINKSLNYEQATD